MYLEKILFCLFNCPYGTWVDTSTPPDTFLFFWVNLYFDRERFVRDHEKKRVLPRLFINLSRLTSYSTTVVFRRQNPRRNSVYTSPGWFGWLPDPKVQRSVWILQDSADSRKYGRRRSFRSFVQIVLDSTGSPLPQTLTHTLGVIWGKMRLDLLHRPKYKSSVYRESGDLSLGFRCLVSVLRERILTGLRPNKGQVTDVRRT